jgi:hypothetical protein
MVWNSPNAVAVVTAAVPGKPAAAPRSTVIGQSLPSARHRCKIDRQPAGI